MYKLWLIVVNFIQYPFQSFSNQRKLAIAEYPHDFHQTSYHEGNSHLFISNTWHLHFLQSQELPCVERSVDEAIGPNARM